MGLIDGKFEERRSSPMLLFIGHSALAVIGSYIIGLPVEATLMRIYTGSALQALTPGMTGMAAVLGFVINRQLRHRAASYVWIGWAVWFLAGVTELSLVNTGGRPRAEYIIFNLIGAPDACAATECLYEFTCTTPLLLSVSYALGAFWARKFTITPAR